MLSVELPADLETPLSAYWKLSQGETHSFLLESVTGGEQLARYSLIGVRPRSVLSGKGSPSSAVRTSLQNRKIDRQAGLPKFAGGLVGYLSYDVSRSIEKLPDTVEDDLGLDDYVLMETDAVVVFDHARNVIKILCPETRSAEGFRRAASEIERIAGLLSGTLPSVPEGEPLDSEVWSNVEKEHFLESVEIARQYIAQGDCIQVVLSQRFSTHAPAHPVAYYRALRSLNPSPYMFLLRLGEIDIVGASPEILVSLDGRTARVRPIAGTRPRGLTPEDDERLEKELLADEKERAEHVMLVDLGRNDLGKVCEVGSVEVRDLMTVERYSHVMHIVSDVTGTLQPDKDGVDLVEACFPAGTVSGAPKVRAMEIIDELETTRRGLYAGAVGYFADTGDLDLAIAIRTILLVDGEAHVQAGAGIVYDSDPEREYAETCSKAAACLSAISRVHEA